MNRKWFVNCDISWCSHLFAVFVHIRKKNVFFFFYSPPHSTIQGTLPISRHFLFVDDAVKAFLLLLDKGTAGEIYNVGTACEVPILQLAKELVKMVRGFKDEADEEGGGRP